MQIGKLRHRVRLEKPAKVQNPDTGEMEPGWALVDTVWASIEPLSAREFIAAQSTQSEVTARIVMRHRADIAPNMRLIYRGKRYDIHGVLPDPKSGLHYITLPVSEGVNDGQ
ncbi:phage head closure protein [Aidingimonas halophila]|uniref:Phage head-tail adaptor, putative, SPP1 family n=1 Tax=Aidingimonas halophila TaxID=574349 RepID=A0A1H2RCZ8_9GAMM|nr:phage head closure protein [Aidingimonas halophila]GHC19452.1 head-tail adaptor protein [Aidingimonas halophila]SDW17175.1 phage head-tail adaptor, putative, SPP1 family [Aidingimonas halophila]